MKRVIMVMISAVLLLAVACTPSRDELQPVIEKTVELPVHEICSLEKAGLSLDIPTEEIAKDPAMERNSATADVTIDYYRTISDYPIVHSQSDMDVQAEKGKYTILYSNIAGDKDVEYFPVGAFTCCKTEDLGKIKQKYFYIDGNYLTEAYAEQYIVDSADGWTVYDFTEIFTNGDFDEAADKLYRRNDFEEPDNTWLKDFRKSIIANRMRYIFKESYSQVETRDNSLAEFQPDLLFEPVDKDKAESSVTELYFSGYGYNTQLKIPDGIDESRITYILDDPNNVISAWHLDHDLIILPSKYGTARITFEYEGKYQIVDVTAGDEYDRRTASDKENTGVVTRLSGEPLAKYPGVSGAVDKSDLTYEEAEALYKKLLAYYLENPAEVDYFGGAYHQDGLLKILVTDKSAEKALAEKLDSDSVFFKECNNSYRHLEDVWYALTASRADKLVTFGNAEIDEEMNRVIVNVGASDEIDGLIDSLKKQKYYVDTEALYILSADSE